MMLSETEDSSAVSGVIKLVRMAKQSGDVLVEISQDGRVTVRSVREAVVMALKKGVMPKYLLCFWVFLLFFIGIFAGFAIDRIYLIKKSGEASNETTLEIVRKSDEVFFSEYETDTLVAIDSLQETALQKGEEFFKNGNFEAAYDSWRKELFSLPDQTKVIVTGVYTNETTAFKVYEKLTQEFRPILAKRETADALQILILVPQATSQEFETTRRRLATRLSIALPKWNSAKTLKRRLQN